MSDPPRPIFIFSLEPWGDMWYSKHHYAAFLARRHPVYFISLPDRWRWTDLFSFTARVRTVKEGVHVVEYRNNLPLRLLPTALADLVTRINAWKLRRLVSSPRLLLWCFHPATVAESPVLRRPGTKVVYHVVDPYQNLPNDSSFARRSDLVVAINPWYLDYYGKLNPDCILVPHGVRSEDRTPRPTQVAHYRELWGDYAVVAAGINDFTNYGLLIQVARDHPRLRLVIIGQLFDLAHVRQKERRDALFALPNVTYAGTKHPNVLRDIIHGARMGLVTYDFEPTRKVPISGVRTPLKVITYLAQNCPTISTLNSYVPTLDGHGSFKAENEEHFVQLVGEVLEGRRTVDKDVVEAYLDSVDYSRLTERILDRLHASADPSAQGSLPSSPEERPVVPADAVILVISNEEWTGPRYSKHRYAIALSRYRRVFFVDPARQWRPSHLLRWRITEQKGEEGVTILSYKNTIPLLGGRLGAINDRLVGFRIRRYLHRNGVPWPLFWSFDPSRLLSPKQLGAVHSVYHCADDHAFRREEERILTRNCDHVLCIARELMPRFQPMNGSVHHFPHGLAEGDMRPAPGSGPLPAAPGYGLYIGNINDRHDFVTWERLFARNPDVTFVIVGPVNVNDPDGRRLIHERPYPNVLFFPAVPYEHLPGLIAGAGFGFLYLRPDHAANRISSQKVIQFLAQGKPFFTSWLSEYAEVEDRVVYMSDGMDEALALFSRFRSEGDPSPAREARIALALEQLYPSLFGRLPFRL